MIVDLDSGVLARREPAGGWIVAYANPDDPPGWDTSVDPRFLEDLAERAPNRFPFLLDLPIDPARCWAGLYPETPDHHAIVGAGCRPSPGCSIAPGSAGTASCTRRRPAAPSPSWCCDGRCDTFDLRPLRPSRFAEGDLVVETAVL